MPLPKIPPLQGGHRIPVWLSRQIATAKHLADDVLDAGGPDAIDDCRYHPLSGSSSLGIPIIFEDRSINGALVGDGDTDAVLLGTLKTPVDAPPIVLAHRQPQPFEPVLSVIAFQKHVDWVPRGSPIGAIGNVRDHHPDGFYSDTDMNPGASGGPVLAWIGEGPRCHLEVVGVNLQTGDPTMNGTPYHDAPDPADRSLSYSLYVDQLADAD